MSSLRQDPTTNEWVIVAPDRKRREMQFKEEVRHLILPEFSDVCPFCPGHEDKSPDVILSFPEKRKKGEGWKVLVLPNKYPALRPEGSLERRQDGWFRRSMDGVGKHEVIVETPLHNRFISQMDYSEVEDIIWVLQERYDELSTDPRFALIMIFQNHGGTAGTSLIHPHSQIIATPVVPAEIRQKLEVATNYYDDSGRCVYIDIVVDELAAGDRIVAESDGFVVFQPFASRYPYETWIAPREHCASFGQATDDQLKELARVLRDTLRRLYILLNDPDYNLVIHTSPLGDENKQYYLWHIQIVPRLTTPAGFEMGSGMNINTAFPEETAAQLRKVEI